MPSVGGVSTFACVSVGPIRRPWGANETGSPSWNEHFSGDFVASKAFYRAVFGYDYQDVSEGEFRDSPYGRIGVVADNQGAVFSVITTPVPLTLR